MDAYVHVKLGRLIYFVPMILGAVHEKSTHYALPNVGVLVILIYA